MIYSLIVAAGNQTRFEIDTPKALMEISGTTLLEYNLRSMSESCDACYVVCSHENEHYFEGSGYNKLIIESGKGCGDAVLQALNMLELTPEDTIFVQWGDCLHTSDIYKLLIKKYKGRFLIPCVFELDPYVQIAQCGNTVAVHFSKYHEETTKGYHDLSVFYGSAIELRAYLRLHAAMLTVASRDKMSYKHRHNNEMQFLDLFNDTSMPATVLPVEGYASISFNTIEEFNNLFS